MKKTFFARLVFLNTFKKRIRASLVIGGIAVTSSAMIVLFGVSLGLHTMVNDQIGNSESRDVVTVDQRNLQQIKLDQTRVSEIQSISGVDQVESSVALLGNLLYDGKDLSIPVYGVSKDFFASQQANFSAGDGSSIGAANIVVSTKVLEVLGLEEAKAVGTNLSVATTISKDNASSLAEATATSKPDSFEISAVISKGQLPVAYLPLEVLQTQGIDSVSQLKVKVSSPDKIGAVRESIEQMGFATSSIQDTVDQINKIFTVIQKTLAIFAVIVFGLTISGTFTIISLTLMEEMKQIGFLRVSGMKNNDVRTLFLLQSVLLTSLGALLGVIGGMIGGAVVNEFASAAASGDVFGGTIRVFAIPTGQIVTVMLLSVAIGVGVGLFPARRAVHMKPLEEMKL